MALSLAGTIVLCCVAVDWGRWFHIQAICLLLMLLLIDRKPTPFAASTAPHQHATPRLRPLATAALLLYATSWTLPIYGGKSCLPGYLPYVWPTYQTTLHRLKHTLLGELQPATRIRSGPSDQALSFNRPESRPPTA